MSEAIEKTVETTGLDLRTIAANVAMFQLNLSCNYHCYYCLAHAQGVIENELPPVDNDAFLAFWEKTGRNWWFVISGGESFLYKNFNDLCARLTKAGHWISVDTNLSQDVSKFIRDVDPNQVVMLSCAYHPESEKKKEVRESFFMKVSALADNGFRICIPYVMHPSRFDDFQIAKKQFAGLGFRLTPQPFRGRHKDKTYPEAYTEQERAIISGELDRPNLYVLPSYKGKPCRAGYSLVRIMPDGKIYRCPGHPRELGDLKTGTLDLFDRVRGCDRDPCGCNRFIRQVDSVRGEESMIESFARDICINEKRIRK